MSRSDPDEPLRWHWLYIPLIAYLVFSVGPSILAPILFVLSFFVDIPVQRLADPISLHSSWASLFGPFCGCMVSLEMH